LSNANLATVQAMHDLDQVMRSWVKVHKPIIKTKITTLKDYWIVTLEEEIDDDEVNYYQDSDLNLHKKWANEQLKNWPDVCRYTDLSVDGYGWRFKKQLDAEKFIMLHTLRWAK